MTSRLNDYSNDGSRLMKTGYKYTNLKRSIIREEMDIEKLIVYRVFKKFLKNSELEY